MVKTWSDLLSGEQLSLPDNCRVEIGPLLEELDISDFISNNHQTPTGAIPLLDITTYKRLLKLDSHLGRLYLNNGMIGIIIAIIVPIRIPDKSVHYYGVTAYFTIRGLYRGNGYGLSLIYAMKEYCALNNVKRGYHIIPVKKGPALHVKQWYYPFNIGLLNIVGFNIEFQPIIKCPVIKSQIKVIHINDTNYKLAHQYWCNYNCNEGFVYWPSPEEYHKFISAIPSYMVVVNNQLLGLFSYEITPLLMNEYYVKAALLQLFSVRSHDDLMIVIYAMINIISQSKEGVAILFGYYWGWLTYIQCMLATNANLYFGCYPNGNPQIIPHPAEMRIPIF